MSWHAALIDNRIELAGELLTSEAPTLWQTLRSLVPPKAKRLDLDLSRVSAIDGRTMALLVDLRASLVARGAVCELVAPESMRPLLHLFGGDRTVATARVVRGGRDDRGTFSQRALERLRTPVLFIGELVDAVIEIVRYPARGNWRSLPGLLERNGADAIGIVLLLDFLVGFVIALQAMSQLEMLGANIYIADLVGISVTRELAPLMTAIIMSGRSGAAFAAELGTMHVNDEIDALETMGISPVPHLVIPRVIALALVAPVLVLIGDVAAITGGLVVGVASMDLTVQAYVTELRSTLELSDIWTGLIKSVAFAIAIACIGCQEGLAARGAAAGVGRRTTATVVASLFTVVVIDSLLTIFFRMVNV